MDPATNSVITKKELQELKAKYDRGMKLQKILAKNPQAAPKPKPALPTPKAGEMLWGPSTPAPSTPAPKQPAREDAAVTAALSQTPASMMAAFQSSQPAAEVVPAQVTKPAVKPQTIKPAIIPQPVKQQAQETVSAKGQQKQAKRNAAANVAISTERQNAQTAQQVEAMSQPLPDKPIKVPVPKGNGGGRGMSRDDVFNYRPGFGLFSGGF